MLRCPPEGANFSSVLDKAVAADQVVRERFNTHCEMIALLCRPESELSAAIPSANPTKTLQGSEVRKTTVDQVSPRYTQLDPKLFIPLCICI